MVVWGRSPQFLFNNNKKKNTFFVVVCYLILWKIMYVFIKKEDINLIKITSSLILKIVKIIETIALKIFRWP